MGLIRLRQRLRRDKLGLFGFVFSGGAERNIAVNLCAIIGYVGFVVWRIGFVLHNRPNTTEIASLRDRKNAEKIGLRKLGGIGRFGISERREETNHEATRIGTKIEKRYEDTNTWGTEARRGKGAKGQSNRGIGTAAGIGGSAPFSTWDRRYAIYYTACD